MLGRKLVLRSVLFLGLMAGTVACFDEPTPKKDTTEMFSEGDLSKAKIALVMEKAATQAVRTKMKAFSPETGADPKYDYKVDDIVYNEKTQQASVDLTATWLARQNSFGSMKKCEISGELLINFSRRKSGLISASFIPNECNEWLKICAKSHNKQEKDILEPITFDPYK